jgi:hypothetical protein
MEIFWRLAFGHLLADFTFQTDFINHWKRTSTKGLLAHCLMHPVFYAALCWPFLNQVWVDFALVGLRLNGWACVVLIFLTHLLEDWWRVFAIDRYRMPDNAAFFLWDQVVHASVLVAVAPLAITSTALGGFFPEKWPVLGCLFVLATHAGTVAVYFVEKDANGADFPGFDEKYLAMSERLVLALCFLLPNVVTAAAFGAGWFAATEWLRRRRVFDLTPISFYGGAAVACCCGLAARVVYYGS